MYNTFIIRRINKEKYKTVDIPRVSKRANLTQGVRICVDVFTSHVSHHKKIFCMNTSFDGIKQ